MNKVAVFKNSTQTKKSIFSQNQCFLEVLAPINTIFKSIFGLQIQLFRSVLKVCIHIFLNARLNI